MCTTRSLLQGSTIMEKSPVTTEYPQSHAERHAMLNMSCVKFPLTGAGDCRCHEYIMQVLLTKMPPIHIFRKSTDIFHMLALIDYLIQI